MMKMMIDVFVCVRMPKYPLFTIAGPDVEYQGTQRYGGTCIWKYARESGEDCSKSARFDQGKDGIFIGVFGQKYPKDCSEDSSVCNSSRSVEISRNCPGGAGKSRGKTKRERYLCTKGGGLLS